MKLLTIVEKVLKYMFYILLMLAVFQAVTIFSEYYSEHPECRGVRGFFKEGCLEEEYEWGREGPPPELIIKVERMNDLRLIIQQAIIMFLGYFVVSQMQDPHPKILKLIKWFKETKE